MATTITLPQGTIISLIRQSTADILLDICSVHPQITPEKEQWKQVSIVTPHPTIDGRNKGHIPHNRDAPVLGCRCQASWNKMLCISLKCSFFSQGFLFARAELPVCCAKFTDHSSSKSQKHPPPPKLSQPHLGIQGFIARCVTDKIGTDVYYFWGC